MPSIKITDRLGANIDAQLAPVSSLLKYVRDLPGLILQGGDIAQLEILKLNDPVVRSLAPSLSFQQPVSLGTGAAQLTIGADAGASFEVISRTAQNTALFAPDDYGANIEIPAAACYVALGFHAAVDAGITSGSGALTFGMSAASGITIQSYRPFSLGPDAVTIVEALRSSIGEFVIPAAADDLDAIPAGVIITINGRGSLRFSASANLLAVANPLATLTLPSPAPALSIVQSGSVNVGASWAVSTDYQVRVQKADARHVQLGWYRRHDSDFSVTASASAGIAAGTSDTDLFSTVIGAISSDARADFDALDKAGVSAGQAASIQSAVQAAASRKLELAVSAEFSSLASDEAAFLYDVDLGALGDEGREAVRAALTGDLSRLADPARLPAGITELRSILTRARASRFAWKVNLLGIFNFGSISQLALSGTVTFTPSTGELVIADQASASRIQTAAVNFGADEEKLRHVMAESFLITAAYRGSQSVISPPELSSSHVFLRLDNSAGRKDMRRFAAIASALGLAAPPVPDGVADFGRSSVRAETHYDDRSTRALFLAADGSPRPRGEYEAAGRQAVALLVLPDGDDSFRLRPVTDDNLWNQMKDLGPANFGQLLPQTQADGVRPDYLAIQWWAESMRGAAEILVQMSRSAPADSKFEKLRHDLASHLRDVAAKAHEQFGTPWGLVAMFLVSGMTAKPAVEIVAQRLVYSSSQMLRAAG